MTKKGLLNEIFSKALYADNTSHYSVGYRDYHSIIEVPLSDFVKISENFEFIPASRIVFVKREGQVLYRKFSLVITNSLIRNFPDSYPISE